MIENGCNLRINSASRIRCPADWLWDSRNARWTDYDLWFVVRGRGILLTPSATYRLGTGSCFLLRPGRFYKGRHDPDHPLEVIFIHFDFLGKTGRPLSLSEAVLPRFHRVIADPSFFSLLLDRVCVSRSAGEETGDKRTVWLKAALCEMDSPRHGESVSPADAGDATRIDALCRKAIADPAKYRKVTDLASEYSCSPDHLCRLFKQHKGTTPIHFLAEARVSYTQSLLASSSLTIGRIAEILGYCDQSHLCRQFTEIVGVNPSRYRNA